MDAKNLTSGQEQYEWFTARTGEIKRKQCWRMQYDYRTTDGVLFSCVSISLEAARLKRDKWVAKRTAEEIVKVKRHIYSNFY